MKLFPRLSPAWPLCRNVSGIFAVQIWEDFAGDFPGGFSGHSCLQKRGENIRRQNPQINPAAQKSKSAKKKFCPKSVHGFPRLCMTLALCATFYDFLTLHFRSPDGLQDLPCRNSINNCWENLLIQTNNLKQNNLPMGTSKLPILKLS